VGWNGHDPILGVVHSGAGITKTTDESVNKAKAAIDYIIAHSPDRIRPTRNPLRSDSTDE